MSEKRLIDANALNTFVALYMAENAYLNDTPLDILKMVSRWIAEAPTIDAVEVVHGRWLDCENYNDIRQCSECGLIRNIYKQEGWKYCPNCGAKMGGVSYA